MSALAMRTIRPRHRPDRRSPGDKLEQLCFDQPGNLRRVVQKPVYVIPFEPKAESQPQPLEVNDQPGIHIDYEGDSRDWPFAEYRDVIRLEPFRAFREEIAHYAWNRLVARGADKGIGPDRLQLAVWTIEDNLQKSPIPEPIPAGCVRFIWKGRFLPPAAEGIEEVIPDAVEEKTPYVISFGSLGM